MAVITQTDMWLDQLDNPERWESKSLTASDRRVLLTQWMGAAMEVLNSRQEYRFRIFEKCRMAMTLDGSGDEKITLEGLEKPYTFSDDEDSSEDEGPSETGSNGPGDGEEGSGGQETVVGGGRNGDNSGEDLDDGDSNDEDDDGKFVFQYIQCNFSFCCCW